MTRCAAIRPILPRMIRRETGPGETLDARRHLGDCAGCSVRAERLASTAASDSTADIASMVMQRLRILRESALVQGMTLPGGSRWGTLAIILGGALAALGLVGPSRGRGMNRPIAELKEWLAGGWAESVREMTEGALPFIARTTHSGLQVELPAGAGHEVFLAVQILATGLGIAFVLAIPAGVLAAWLIHESRRS